MLKLGNSVRLSVAVIACCSFILAASATVAASPAEKLQQANASALQRAIKDLVATFGDRYPHGKQYLSQAAAYAKESATC